MDEENAGEGREVKKSVLNLMWGGVWLPIGDAEVLVEKGRIVKVLSFTPRDFAQDPIVADGTNAVE